MGKRITVSFTNDEEDLLEKIEEMQEKDRYKSRSAVITHCIEVGLKELDDKETFT